VTEIKRTLYLKGEKIVEAFGVKDGHMDTDSRPRPWFSALKMPGTKPRCTGAWAGHLLGGQSKME
jgi:hypothetical protein